MTMYQELHRWEDAIAVAEARVRPGEVRGEDEKVCVEGGGYVCMGEWLGM